MSDRTTGGRDELSYRLQELRRSAGLSTTRVAALLAEGGFPVSQAKVSRTENGRVAADPEFIGRLCDLYGTTEDEKLKLVDLAAEIRKGNRRLVLGRDEAAAQTRIGKFERESTLIRSFTLSAVPGELQTEQYMRVIFDSDAGVRQRLINQAILDDATSARRFTLLLAEGALGWAPLPPADMAAQVDHIAAAIDRRNVQVGIVPWGCPTPVLPLQAWYLFDTRLVVTGGATYALDLTDSEDVAAYAAMTDELERIAVYDDEARAILAGIAARYRAMGA
jgi:transcriptional regulator with XRE-family HTH domain